MYNIFGERVQYFDSLLLFFLIVEQRKNALKKVLRKRSVRNSTTLRPGTVNDNINSNSMSTMKAKTKKPKGKLAKKKTRKAIRITGLDLLHNQTLLSTSPQGNANLNNLCL